MKKLNELKWESRCRVAKGMLTLSYVDPGAC